VSKFEDGGIIKGDDLERNYKRLNSGEIYFTEKGNSYLLNKDGVFLLEIEFIVRFNEFKYQIKRRLIPPLQSLCQSLHKLLRKDQK